MDISIFNNSKFFIFIKASEFYLHIVKSSNKVHSEHNFIFSMFLKIASIKIIFASVLSSIYVIDKKIKPNKETMILARVTLIIDIQK